MEVGFSKTGTEAQEGKRTSRTAPWQAAKDLDTSHEKSTWPYGGRLPRISHGFGAGRSASHRCINEIEKKSTSLMFVNHAEAGSAAQSS